MEGELRHSRNREWLNQEADTLLSDLRCSAAGLPVMGCFWGLRQTWLYTTTSLRPRCLTSQHPLPVLGTGPKRTPTFLRFPFLSQAEVKSDAGVGVGGCSRDPGIPNFFCPSL